jgi:hypothetical protein
VGALEIEGGGAYQFGFRVVEIIFGSIILLLGNLASFFKVNSEIIGDEIGESYRR